MPWSEVQWDAALTDYISDPDSSYRKIAAKYGMSPSAVSDRARRGNWPALKEAQQRKLILKASNRVIDSSARRLARMLEVSDQILAQIEAIVGDPTQRIDPQSLKQITGAMKDLKEIQMIRSALDDREQKARILHLERQVEEYQSGSNAIEVRIDDTLEDLAR